MTRQTLQVRKKSIWRPAYIDSSSTQTQQKLYGKGEDRWERLFPETKEATSNRHKISSIRAPSRFWLLRESRWFLERNPWRCMGIQYPINCIFTVFVAAVGFVSPCLSDRTSHDLGFAPITLPHRPPQPKLHKATYSYCNQLQLSNLFSSFIVQGTISISYERLQTSSPSLTQTSNFVFVPLMKRRKSIFLAVL